MEGAGSFLFSLKENFKIVWKKNCVNHSFFFFWPFTFFFSFKYLWKILVLESSHLLLHLLYHCLITKKIKILWFLFYPIVAHRRDEMWSEGRHDYERLPRERGPPRNHPNVSSFSTCRIIENLESKSFWYTTGRPLNKIFKGQKFTILG